ncbi:MAG: radical SAM family heme chaperone HemW [Pseudomonadota bacterium]
MADRADAGPGFGVYIHWPFCLAKCPYCDFNSHVRASIDQTRWQGALVRELTHFAAETGGRQVTSVFFGGGTPSLMAPETAAACLEAIANLWRLAPNAEITLEANPTSVEAGRFGELRAAGINRLSLGVQALDDDVLAFLGRQHSAAEALLAIDLVRGLFDRWSFDLIYARPNQSPAAWRAELKRGLKEGARHLSLYQLTIEPGTAFHGAWRRGELQTPNEDQAAGLYELTQEIMADTGLPAYEISNHAAPGEASRHNLLYWRGGDYVGVGPGAHGRLTLEGTKVATRQHRAPEAWLERVECSGHATRQRKQLSPEERLAELTMMGLRLSEGISLAAFRREAGAGPEDLFESKRLNTLRERGLLALDNRALKTTVEGRQRLNAVLAYLLA